MANRKEAIVGIPVTVPVVEVEVALGTVLVEVEHVAVEVHLRNGALYEKPSMALLPDASRELYRIRDLILSLSFSHQLSLVF